MVVCVTCKCAYVPAVRTSHAVLPGYLSLVPCCNIGPGVCYSDNIGIGVLYLCVVSSVSVYALLMQVILHTPSGFNVEYSSMSFALLFLAEYCHIILMSTFGVLVFPGGWLLPFIILWSTLSFYHIV